MNKQTKNLIGVDDEDYRKWCKENKKSIHKKTTKEEFFKRILDQKLVKSSETGDLMKIKKGDLC